MADATFNALDEQPRDKLLIVRDWAMASRRFVALSRQLMAEGVLTDDNPPEYSDEMNRMDSQAANIEDLLAALGIPVADTSPPKYLA